MSVRQLPHYTLPAATLADWIDSQPDQWWSVDGDYRLMSTVDFPCPSDELSLQLRHIGKDLLVYDKTPGSTAHGEVIAASQLDALADTDNRLHERTYLLNWCDSDQDWLLMEDEALVPK
jgi:hypothetical protein